MTGGLSAGGASGCLYLTPRGGEGADLGRSVLDFFFLTRYIFDSGFLDLENRFQDT